MVAALNETLLDESRRDVVLADARALIDAEVADKKGASGLAVKGGYATIKKVNPTIVTEALDKLLPEFFTKLQPYWQEFTATGTGRFADHLVAKGDEVADALLSVTDARIDASSKQAIKKVYSSMRPAAKKNVVEALPRLGDLVQKHAV